MGVRHRVALSTVRYYVQVNRALNPGVQGIRFRYAVTAERGPVELRAQLYRVLAPNGTEGYGTFRPISTGYPSL